MDSTIYINDIEIILLILSLVTLFGVALTTIKSVQKAIILTILLIPVLYLSVEGNTQFLTVDSVTHSEQIVNMETSNLRTWNESYAYKTSFATVGTLLSLLKRYTYIGMTMDYTDLNILTKAIFWFLCILIITTIYYFLDKYYISPEQKLIYFIVYFYSVLLFPSNLFTFKLITYNPFSMSLGVLAIVLILITLKEKSEKFALASIIIATLAAHEKIIASPVLLGAMFIFTYLKLSKLNISTFSIKTLESTFKTVLYAIAVVFLTEIITFLIAKIITRPDNVLHISFNSLVHPMTTPLIYAGIHSYFFAFLAVIFILVLFPVIFIKIKTKINFHSLKNNSSAISIISLSTLIIILIVGVIAANLVEPIRHLIDDGPYTGNYYLSPKIRHGFQRYFVGAETYYEYVIHKIGFAYHLFTRVIPSIYFIVIPLLVLYKRYKQVRFFLEWEIVMLIALVMPLIYAIVDMPLSSSYFDLFLFCTIIVISLNIANSVTHQHIFKKWFLVSLVTLPLLIEVLPFRPSFSALVRFWDTKMLGSAGGVEYFVVGKKIEDLMVAGHIQKEPTYIRGIYPGVWLKKSDTPIKAISSIRGMECKTSDSDYYIITKRVSAMADSFVNIKPYFKDMNFLNNIEPFLKISSGGETYIWVYRADKIKHKFSSYFLAQCKKTIAY